MSEVSDKSCLKRLAFYHNIIVFKYAKKLQKINNRHQIENALSFPVEELIIVFSSIVRLSKYSNLYSFGNNNNGRSFCFTDKVSMVI